MIQSGIDCDLSTLEEAYDNYMRHYDSFFYIPEYRAQYLTLRDEGIALGLVVEINGSYQLKDFTLKEALVRIDAAG
jgi:hypothetical protein